MDPQLSQTPSPSAQPETPAPAATPPVPPAPVHKKGSGFFAMLGKLFLFLLIAAALLAGGYYLGKNANKTTMQLAPIPTQAMVSPTPMPPTPTPASATTKTVKAGLTGSTAFKPYSIDVPDGWTDVDENTQTANVDKLTITKDEYSLTINQGAFGGGGCTYKGDPPQQMAQTFTDAADINGKSAQYRRSWNADATAKTISYSVCQKATDNSYGSITTFGRIDVVSPNPADPAVLAQIDGMIASMVQQ